jgi:hypothetical protein
MTAKSEIRLEWLRHDLSASLSIVTHGSFVALGLVFGSTQSKSAAMIIRGPCDEQSDPEAATSFLRQQFVAAYPPISFVYWLANALEFPWFSPSLSLLLSTTSQPASRPTTDFPKAGLARNLLGGPDLFHLAAASSMKSAARSAIITMGSLADMMVGMIEPSTTRNDLTPLTRSCGSNPVRASSMGPLHAVPTGR